MVVVLGIDDQAGTVRGAVRAGTADSSEQTAASAPEAGTRYGRSAERSLERSRGVVRCVRCINANWSGRHICGAAGHEPAADVQFADDSSSSISVTAASDGTRRVRTRSDDQCWSCANSAVGGAAISAGNGTLHTCGGEVTRCTGRGATPAGREDAAGIDVQAARCIASGRRDAYRTSAANRRRCGRVAARGER